MTPFSWRSLHFDFSISFDRVWCSVCTSSLQRQSRIISNSRDYLFRWSVHVELVRYCGARHTDFKCKSRPSSGVLIHHLSDASIFLHLILFLLISPPDSHSLSLSFIHSSATLICVSIDSFAVACLHPSYFILAFVLLCDCMRLHLLVFGA